MISYNQVTDDLGLLGAFIDQYDRELIQAKAECKISGNIETNLKALPGITEYRFGQLQEIESVLNFLNLELKRVKRKHFKKYLEGYARALSSRDAEKYAEGEDEVINYELLVNEVALLRNKFVAVTKGLETKNFMVGHIVRLRAAGLEDAVL